MRACPDCGVPEQRQTVNGRDVVNLDPVTGLCVDCLVARSKLKAMPDVPVVYDFQRAASGDEQ